MPATPAWPPASLPRLFVDQTLSEGLSPVTVDGNYLGAVLRLGAGRPGETVRRPHRRMAGRDRRGRQEARRRWPSATRCASARRCPTCGCCSRRSSAAGSTGWSRRRPSSASPGCVPVITRRTIVDRLNLDRLRAHAIEAAEQCERTALPELAEPRKLDAVLKDWPADRMLYFADESGGEPFASRARPRRDPDRPRRRLHR